MIVELPDGADAATLVERTRRLRGAVPSAEAGEPAAGHVIGSLPLAAMRVDAAQLASLMASGAVVSVREDRLLRPSLKQSVPLIGAPQAWGSSATGAGQAIAILDTGVDSAHPFLAGKVVAEACFSSTDPAEGARTLCPNGKETQIGTGAGRNCPAAVEGCEHGTHVAGIAAGRGSTFSGVARDARIVAVQVFSRFPRLSGGCALDDCALAYESDLLRALDHVRSIAATVHVAAVNISLGGGYHSTACDADPVKLAIDRLLAAGVVTVVASGNDYNSDAVTWPACVSTAVAVGATTDSTDMVAAFTNMASLVDLLAPGAVVTSSVPGGRFMAMEGTSMAAPHVAGAFAALRSARPDATVQSLLGALATSGKPLTDADSRITRPRIDLAAALAALTRENPSWRPWARIGAIAAAREIACIEVDGQSIDCMALNATGAASSIRWSGSKWGSWTDIAGSLATTTSCVQVGTVLHCVAVGTDGRLKVTGRENGTWRGPLSLGGAFRDRPSCLPRGSTGIDCFVRGTDQQMWQIAYLDGRWQAAIARGGKLATRPVCLARDGGIDCLATTADRTLTWRRYAGGTWSPWRTAGGKLLQTPGCAVTGKTLRCVGESTAHRPTTARLANGGWSSWSSLGGSVWGTPSCTADEGAKVDCFARTGTGSLALRSFDGTAWRAATDLGGSISSDPSCTSTSGRGLECFAVGSDGKVRATAYR